MHYHKKDTYRKSIISKIKFNSYRETIHKNMYL